MENSKFKKEYKLKQHTMLLHFQAKPSSGENVCLRASEVKPKLDRFILKKLGEIKTVKEKYSSWIQAVHLNEKDVAFKYRMTIKADKPEFIEPNRIPKIYYGNMGDGPKKYGVFFIDGLKIQITCFIPDLQKFIEENIAEFFAVTNFGTMQNKGFGSFTVMGEKYKCDIPKALKDYYGATCCCKINVGNRRDVQKEMFDTIKQVYSVMKSGSRVPFKHSYIYEYMHNEYKVNGDRVNIGNEKAYMKKKGVSPNRKTNPWVIRNWEKKDILGVRMDDRKYRYIRAVLGIGEELKYFTDVPDWYETNKGDIKYDRNNNPMIAKEVITIEHVPNDSGEKFANNSKEKIEHFSSPIFFKTIDNDIYMVAGRIDEKIKGKFFCFKNDSKKGLKHRENQTNGEVVLQVPNEFDIDDFMEKFVEFYNTDYLNCDHSKNQNFKKHRIEEV